VIVKWCMCLTAASSILLGGGVASYAAAGETPITCDFTKVGASRSAGEQDATVTLSIKTQPPTANLPVTWSRNGKAFVTTRTNSDGHAQASLKRPVPSEGFAAKATLGTGGSCEDRTFDLVVSPCGSLVGTCPTRPTTTTTLPIVIDGPGAPGPGPTGPRLSAAPAPEPVIARPRFTG
jgi:hypothetical protein